MRGTVKWFNQVKGYGFITPEDGGKDVFVHTSAVEKAGIDDIDEGHKLEFDTQPSQKEGKGPTAVNLKRA